MMLSIFSLFYSLRCNLSKSRVRRHCILCLHSPCEHQWSYNRETEIEFTWTDDVRQFYPIPPAVYRQMLAAKPMYLFLDRVFKQQRVRFDHVRTEAKRAIMMARIASELLGRI
jgi:hypothetical protein